MKSTSSSRVPILVGRTVPIVFPTALVRLYTWVREGPHRGRDHSQRKAGAANEHERPGALLARKINDMNEMSMESVALAGSCLCGTVRFQISPPFSKFAHCHCTRCRKATGAAHASNIYLTPEQLTWLAGQDAIARYNLPSALSFARWFCSQCGSLVPRLSRSGKTVVVPAGSLDDQPMENPRARIFCDSEAPWVCVGDDLPRHPQYPSWW